MLFLFLLYISISVIPKSQFNVISKSWIYMFPYFDWYFNSKQFYMAIRKFISSYLIFFYFFFNLLFIFYFFFFSFFFFSLSLSLPSPSPFHYSILFVFIVPVKFMSTFSILLVKFHRQSADRSKNLDIYMDKEESGKKRNR